MNTESITAVIAAFATLVVAFTGLVATLKGLKSMATKQDANATKLAEVHEAVGAIPSAAPGEVKQ